MPYTTVMDLNFDPANYPFPSPVSTADPLTEALRWGSIMNGGSVVDTVANHASLETIAHPLFVDDGADSHLLFSWAETPVEVAGAYKTKTLMDADLDPVAGTMVNCWDPDPTKRGRYSKTGGAGTGPWTLVTGTPADKGWPDYNHPQRLLEILIAAFAYSATPLSFMGNPGFRGITDGDWTNARLTWDIRAVNLRIGPWTKIGQHIQGNHPARAAALTDAYGEGDKFFIPNFINKRQLLSDALGFGNDSWGRPNAVPIVRDSGWVEWVVDFTTDDKDWECYGDPGRDPTGREVNYGVAPIAEILTDLHGNLHVHAHHDTPHDAEAWWSGNDSAATISDFDRISGEIRVRGVKLEQWSA